MIFLFILFHNTVKNTKTVNPIEILQKKKVHNSVIMYAPVRAFTRQIIKINSN